MYVDSAYCEKQIGWRQSPHFTLVLILRFGVTRLTSHLIRLHYFMEVLFAQYHIHTYISGNICSTGMDSSQAMFTKYRMDSSIYVKAAIAKYQLHARPSMFSKL